MNTLAPTQANSAAIDAPTLLHRWSKSLLLKVLRNLRYGQVTIRENNQEIICGSDKKLQVTLNIHCPSVYARILWGGSIGAGESYVEGLWSASDLTALVRIMVLNMDLLDAIERKLGWLLRPFRAIQRLLRTNSRNGSKRNILAHYDLGNDMYQSFLDETMMYSSALFPDETSSLEDASRHKLEHICRSLKLCREDRVIEIGSGWGGFALHAAAHYGCHVTTTTISEAQYLVAKQRIDKAGLQGKITLLKKDYRDLDGRYDKLVSIEMIEAVGHNYLPLFFEKCNSLLKPDGMMLIQAITMADQKYNKYIREFDFIQKHIFPGGSLVANNLMLKLLAEKTDMVARHIVDFGFDYARTLREWRKRFLASFSALQKRGYDERFKRLWEFYLSYCEGGFRERSISVVHLIATKPMNRISIPR